MNSINRQIVIIKPKGPYVTWINSLSSITDDPISIESLSNDCTALLLPHFDEGKDLLKFIKNIYKQIFEMELESWTTDKKSWPPKLNFSLFRDWFEIEFHSEIFDFGDGDIEIDEY